MAFELIVSVDHGHIAPPAGVHHGQDLSRSTSSYRPSPARKKLRPASRRSSSEPFRFEYPSRNLCVAWRLR